MCACLQIRRAERGAQQLDLTKRSLKQILAACEDRDVAKVLDAQGAALFQLAGVGELLVPGFPFRVSTCMCICDDI